MLIKISVPFILAAAAFAASVPTLDRRDITANIGCRPAQVQENDVPSGVIAVRSNQGLVGYLCEPKVCESKGEDNGQAFGFTGDRARALIADIIPLKGQDNSGDGNYMGVHIGLHGKDQSFIGAAPLNGAPPSGAPPPSGPPPIAGGSPPSGGAPPTGGSPPSGGAPSTGGSPPSGSAPAVGLPPVSPSGGAPSVGKPAIGDVGSELEHMVALAVVSTVDLATEATLEDTEKPWNLLFFYDKENGQIVPKGKTGDAQPQFTNWKLDDGHFCLLDHLPAAHGAGAGDVSFFLVPN